MATPVDFVRRPRALPGRGGPADDPQAHRDNRLTDGTLALGGERVGLTRIRPPVLNVVAERDHIVPLAAAAPLLGLIGGPDVEKLRLAAGHVGLVAGRAAAKVTLPGIVG